MSRRGVIEATPPATCEMCGERRELRPYGPHGENVCFGCAMKDEPAAKRQMSRLVFGETVN